MYKVKIEKLKKDNSPDRYDQWKEIYEQVVENLDVSALVTIINKKDE